jgi:DNA-binding FadR family transcriptional regulator
VNDFRSHGSIPLLDALLTYQDDRLSRGMWQNMFDFRRVIEAETARLAAQDRTEEQIRTLEAILEQEACVDRCDPEKLTELDFAFHLAIAQISGNLVYPLLINSFKNAYTSYTRAFFSANAGTHVVEEVFAFHTRLVAAICSQAVQTAQETMIAMLIHGERTLKGNGL